jgi:hypothetical protein
LPDGDYELTRKNRTRTPEAKKKPVENNQEPTQLTFREFCERFDLDAPAGTSNQPKAGVVQGFITQAEAKGHTGWVWISDKKHLVKKVDK